MKVNKLILKEDILDRFGWSEDAISKFKPQEVHSKSNKRNVWFRKIDIFNIENSEEWKEYISQLEKRKREIDKNTQHIIDALDIITVKINKVDDVVGKAMQSYNDLKYNICHSNEYCERDYRKATRDSDIKFLHRISVNYLRFHQMESNVDFKKLFGTNENLNFLRPISEKIYKEIARVYPQLIDACEDQYYYKFGCCLHLPYEDKKPVLLHKEILPKGTYYLGDPCYMLDANVMTKLEDSLNSIKCEYPMGNPNSEFWIARGRVYSDEYFKNICKKDYICGQFLKEDEQKIVAYYAIYGHGGFYSDFGTMLTDSSLFSLVPKKFVIKTDYLDKCTELNFDNKVRFSTWSNGSIIIEEKDGGKIEIITDKWDDDFDEDEFIY